MKAISKKETPVIKIKMIKGKANLLKSITEIQVTGKKLEALIHTTAVSVLVHSEQHREVSLCNKLIEAVPCMVRKNALREWMLTFGAMTFDTETKLMVFSKKGKFDTAKATQTPFYDFIPEKEYVPYDLLAMVTNIVNTADKRLEKGNKKDKIPSDTLNALRKLVA